MSIQIPIKKRSGIVAHALVDIDDMYRALQYKWHLTDKGYAATTSKKIMMHRFILKLKRWKDDKRDVDHINHNRLDNRKLNLRIVNRTINCLHRKGANKNSKTGIIGVCVKKRCTNKKYYVQFSLAGKKYYGGYFNCLKKAEKAFKELKSRILEKEGLSR